MNIRTVGYLASGALSVATIGLVLALSHRPSQGIAQKDLLVSKAAEREIAQALDSAMVLRSAPTQTWGQHLPNFQEGMEYRRRALEDAGRIAPVPEPSGVATLGLGLALFCRRKPRR
ncbi:MAG: PEP-CTERM sorting domain-containing protein [Armatimonadetes bacterium]|nr:PEP-CTERM sorting domain-containing protein [Armatimonadota bacterium]